MKGNPLLELARPRLSRRSLLQGTALAAVPYALLPSPRAGAHIPGPDYPLAEWRPASTANYTAANRPATHPVDQVIIHVTQTTYPNTLTVFENPRKQVSAHYVVRSADGHTSQCVREADIAWHAGDWDRNTRSVGIEHEGWIDEPGYFTDVLYETSARLTATICARHGIPKDRAHIIGHYEVPGTDHTDPGPHWDWTRYIRLVNRA
ncbi:MAG: N-acetylmuramoyl-L-alanine amidase [Streptomyces sp.]|nr:N-acetylmuramoyl-L-alanine amidase [Streptomyces sp.]